LHAAIVVLAVVSAAFWLGFMRLPGERVVGGKEGAQGGGETTIATTRNAGFSKTHSIKHQLPPRFSPTHLGIA